MRLAQMQDWPVFWMRALTAWVTALSRSAEGMTMKGSEPPSSRTTFFRLRPGLFGNRDARTLAAREGDGDDAVIGDDAGDGAGFDCEVLEQPVRAAGGEHHFLHQFRAQPWTMLACFSRPILPAMIVGARKRTACQ